jgi:hypothetical protein
MLPTESVDINFKRALQIPIPYELVLKNLRLIQELPDVPEKCYV